MAENRISREAKTREKTERKTAWTRPQILPTPEPQDGYGFRWVRISMLGRDDPSNLSMKMREGWVPVKAEDHKDIYSEAKPGERFEANVVQRGLILCKAPMEMIEARKEFYENQAEAQIEAVDNNLLREQDHRMPLYSTRKSEVKFGNNS